MARFHFGVCISTNYGWLLTNLSSIGQNTFKVTVSIGADVPLITTGEIVKRNDMEEFFWKARLCYQEAQRHEPIWNFEREG